MRGHGAVLPLLAIEPTVGGNPDLLVECFHLGCVDPDAYLPHNVLMGNGVIR